MTNGEAVNWLINIAADIGKAEHRGLWHYEQALCEIREMLESAQPELSEWCHDCKEYDKDRHCCPRFNRVIQQTVEEIKAEQPEVIRCKDCKYYQHSEISEHMVCRYIIGESIIRREADFCSRAERRTDE